jgi:ABC-type lipoprotein release transport system permease subunit
MALLYVIVLAITATVIVNTLVMAVFERQREIGILSALGMTSRRITLMFLIESTLLAIGGIAIGLVIGGVLVAYATKYGFHVGDLGMTGIMLGETIYAHLTLSDTLTLSFTALIVTIVAALYPAWLAARMEPVDALRGGQ